MRLWYLFTSNQGVKMKYKFVFPIMVMVTMVWTPNHVEAQQANLPEEVIAYADTVLYNGKILTADSKFSVVEAVAIRDGKFLAVGKTDRIRAMAGPKTRQIDLRRMTVTPGILDLHSHPFAFGWSDYWTEKWIPDNRSWTTREEAMQGLQQVVARAKPGEPIILRRLGLARPVSGATGGRGGNFCDVFTREEIDALSPANPIFFISDIANSTLSMNSKAAEVIKPYLPEGVASPFIKDHNLCVAQGADLDGILSPGTQAANDYVFWVTPPENMLDFYQDAQKRVNAAGVVLVKEHLGVPLFNGIRALWERGELTVRYRMPFPMIPQISGHTVQLPDGANAEAFFRRWANMSSIGDPMLRLVGIRLPAIGGNVLGGDAWMLEPKLRPYPDRRGNPAPYGGRIQEQEAVERGDEKTFRGYDVLVQGIRFGWNVSADHTIGDRAYREVIKAVEKALQDQIVKRPNQRITTNHTPMASLEDIRKAAKLKVWSSISTGHAIGDEHPDLEAGLLAYGTERVNKMAPIKSYLTSGLHPSLEGTYWKGVYNKGRTRSAFFWISKAITRKDETYQRAWNAIEALNRQEALWAATLWPAEQLAEDKDLGSIEVDKQADLVIIDKDYLTVPEDDIQKIQVLLTMVSGNVVFEVKGDI